MGLFLLHRWLKRPSTICLDRTLLPPYLPTTRFPFQAPVRQGVSYLPPFSDHNTAAEHDHDEQDEPRGHREAQGYYRRARSDTTPENVPQSALCVSLDARAPIVSEDPRHRNVFQSLQPQTNVARIDRSLERFPDDPFHRPNFELWSEILQYRERVDGFAGVHDVWKRMRTREIDLPIEGEHADILWQTFIKACFPPRVASGDEQFLKEVLAYAMELKSRTGLEYHALYRCIMGEQLRTRPRQAFGMHLRLWRSVEFSNIDLRGIGTEYASCAWLGPSSRSRFSVKKIVERSKQKDLYDHFVPAIARKHGTATALPWHKMFLANGDAPSTQVLSLPEIQHLFDHDNGKSPPMLRSKPAFKTRYYDAKPSAFPALSRANMSALVGDVHGIKPREISDSFVAKLFATRAFSLDMVINGLSFFGIDHLGPLALREMALRANSLVNCSNKLSVLKNNGIAVGRSTYGQILQRLTMLDNSAKLFDALMASDQHPEAFDDIQTQKSLFRSFLDQGDWLNAHLTLIGLTFQDQDAQSQAWNQLLQHYIKSTDLPAVANLAKQMQTQGIVMDTQTLSYLRRHLLPRRRRGKGPTSDKLAYVLGTSTLQFVSSAYMHAASKGVKVDLHFWREALKRYGMMRRWNELERLAVWLASHYAPMKDRIVVRRNRLLVRVNPFLNQIFTQQMRQAFVVWAFDNAAARKCLIAVPGQTSNEASELAAADSSSQLSHHVARLSRGQRWAISYAQQHCCEFWAGGISLLKRLHSMRVKSRPELVRKALLGRMWILFGPAYSTRGMNQEAIRFNKISLAHYIKHANEIWDGKLFDLDPRLYEPANHPYLLVALFGARRFNRKTREYVNVSQYARFLLAGARKQWHRNARVRRRWWEQSGLRLIKKKPITPSSESTSDEDQNSFTYPRHQSPAAHSSNSHPPPSPGDTQAPA